VGYIYIAKCISGVLGLQCLYGSAWRILIDECFQIDKPSSFDHELFEISKKTSAQLGNHEVVFHVVGHHYDMASDFLISSSYAIPNAHVLINVVYQCI
jgi:hypothetical protein